MVATGRLPPVTRPSAKDRNQPKPVRRPSALVEHHPDPVDLLAQRGVIDLGVNRQIDHVGQQQVVEFFHQAQQVAIGERVALEGQVDVRAPLVIALGARALQHRLLDRRAGRQHLLYRCYGLGWQAGARGQIAHSAFRAPAPSAPPRPAARGSRG